MPGSIAENTITLSDGTEHDLASADTSNKTYVVTLDLSAMVNGDVVDVRIYIVPKTGGTERLLYAKTYANAQAEPIVQSVPVPARHSFRATIQATANGQHAYDWEILSLP